MARGWRWKVSALWETLKVRSHAHVEAVVHPYLLPVDPLPDHSVGVLRLANEVPRNGNHDFVLGEPEYSFQIEIMIFIY